MARKTEKSLSKPNPWTDNDVKFVRENMGEMQVKSIAEALGRSLSAISCKIRAIRMKEGLKSSRTKNHRRGWSEDEYQIVRDNWPTKSREEMMALLPNRSFSTIQSTASNLGIKRHPALVQESRIRAALASVPANEAKRVGYEALPPAMFYGDKVGNAKVYRADQRPRHMDKRPDALPRRINHISGSTLSVAI